MRITTITAFMLACFAAPIADVSAAALPYGEVRGISDKSPSPHPALSPPFGSGEGNSRARWSPILPSHQPHQFLPILIIDTGGERCQGRARLAARVSVIPLSDGGPDVFDPPEFYGPAQISIRGSSSSVEPKSPFRLELQDEDGRDKKVSILGMPTESDWVLYPSALDRSFVRTLLAHELWRQMGHYAVRWRLVELFFDSGPESQVARRAVLPERLDRLNAGCGFGSLSDPLGVRLLQSSEDEAQGSLTSPCPLPSLRERRGRGPCELVDYPAASSICAPHGALSGREHPLVGILPVSY